MVDRRSPADAIATYAGSPAPSRGGLEGACLVCGAVPLVAEQGLPRGRLRCSACRAVHDVGDRSASVPGGGELVLPPATTPRSMAVSVRTERTVAGSPYRHDMARPPTRVVVRWRERSARAWMLVGLPICAVITVLMLLAGGAIAVLFMPLVLVIGYVLVATGTSRFELVAENGRVELARKGLLLPPATEVLSRYISGADGQLRADVAPQTISATRPRDVRLVRRTITVPGRESFDYYGVAFLDENGRDVERAISTDIEEARFVFRVMAGFFPVGDDRVRSGLALPRPRAM